MNIYHNLQLKPLDKRVYLTSDLHVMYANEKNHRIFTHKTASEHFKIENLVFYYPKNFFLIEVIDEKLGVIIASGLVEHWINSIETHPWADDKPKRERKKLSLTHLCGAFYVLVTGYVISFVVFVLESMIVKLNESAQ